MFKVKIKKRFSFSKKCYASKIFYGSRGWDASDFSKSHSQAKYVVMDQEGLARIQDAFMFRPFYKVIYDFFKEEQHDT